MKNAALFFLACAGLIASCKKSDEKSSTLTAKINGVAFTASTVSVVVQQPDYKIIKATSGSKSITVINSGVQGLYSLGIYSPDGLKADSSQMFSLTTVRLNDKNSESGEFDFVTTDSVVITEGKYEAHW